ncbi:eukaryotic translation initiation factor mextil isoform X2 [Haematobia irritans]|uniref:eukaryotic translation initiation factor mextil isoform X2 n=1 Tax=Haematobia irritans TaxID=7368 RepID=UPI003F50AD76
MAHLGRSVKNVEAPRPLKSQSRSSLKNNYMLIEELMQLIENVAISLQSGINNTEPMATLVQNLRVHGPQLETVSKDTLDRAFVVFRNASQDERLNIMTRLNLLELIELRAKGWEDNGINAYYKIKQATNAELNDIQNHAVDPTQTAFLSTSPTFGGMNAGNAAAAAAAIASVGSANQQHLLLSPGEVIRNSGKFPKPTKIPGKTYCKDEVVIRNADSGKVMGIKGRRVHMIEELSETIISFQRVNPGAKERLVQITGPAEDKINYAKQLIEDTIRRNASPVRLDPAMGNHAGGGGSCSSLASSNSDDAVQTRTPSGSHLTNRLSFNSAQNFMTAAAASQQMVQQQLANVQALSSTTPVANAATVAGEYKFTVGVGQHVIKITGDCCDLVRVAKLVLDDYFSSAEFLASMEAGAAFDGTMASPISTPTTPMTGAPQFIMGTPLHTSSPLATDSGIGLNYMSSANSNNNQDGDDDVFVDGNNINKSGSQSNGLARSRRSHFSRKDSTPEAPVTAATQIARQKSEVGTSAPANNNNATSRIVHQYEHLIYYAKSPHSWALPNEWQRICEKFPAIIRNKVKTTHVVCSGTTNPTTLTPYYSPSLTLRVACNNNAALSSIITTTPSVTTNTSTTTSTASASNLISEVDSKSTDSQSITTIMPTIANVTNSNVHNNLSLNYNFNNINNNEITCLNETHTNEKVSEHNTKNSSATVVTNNIFKSSPFGGSMSLNIKRKGFFNRLTYSIDEDGYEASMKTPSPGVEQLPPNFNQHNHSPLTATVTGGSGRLSNIHINRALVSIRTSPMTASPSIMSSHEVATATHIPYEANTRQKLLNKQMKIISDIMVESSKTGNSKSSESLKGNDQKAMNNNGEIDDNDVQIVSSTIQSPSDSEKDVTLLNQTRPKLRVEIRSYSTCD